MFNDEDIEVIEEDEQNVSPSNTYTKNLHSPNQKTDNFKNKIQNNEQTTSSINKANAESSMDNGNQFKKAGNVRNISKGLASDDPEVQKESLKELGKDSIKPIVRKGVQAATGGAIGTDPVTGKIIDKAVDKVADNPQVDKIIGEVTEKVQKKKKKMMIPIIGGLLSFFTPFFVVIIVATTPVGLANDFLGVVKSVAIDLLDFLTWNGICTGEECQIRYENRFYTVVNDYTAKYEDICSNSMDSDLITAAIFYEQMVTEEDYDYGAAHGEFMKLSSILYPNFFVDYSEDNNYWTKLLSVVTLDEFFETYNEIKNALTKEEVKCSGDYDNFISYLNNNYIDSKYSKLKKGDYNYYTNSIIITEIMSFSNSYFYGEEGGTITTGQTIVGAGVAGAVPEEIIAVSQNPLGEQQTTQTSCYGFYSVNNCTAHGGVDLTSNASSPQIYSIADGTVVSVTLSMPHCTPDWKNGKACSVCANSGGNSITIKHMVKIDGVETTFYSQYYHLDSVSVRNEQQVSKGDAIAIMGNTGCSTGRHLHFNLLDSQRKKYNPEELLQAVGVTVKSSCVEARAQCR